MALWHSIKPPAWLLGHCCALWAYSTITTIVIKIVVSYRIGPDYSPEHPIWTGSARGLRHHMALNIRLRESLVSLLTQLTELSQSPSSKIQSRREPLKCFPFYCIIIITLHYYAEPLTQIIDKGSPASRRTAPNWTIMFSVSSSLCSRLL